MKFIIQFDGVLADVQPVWYEAHRRAAAAVGWSKVDAATFWRLTRTKGRAANLLAAAKPFKVEKYYEAFDDLIECDELLALARIDESMREPMRRLTHKGVCDVVTLGGNVAARQSLLDAGHVSSEAVAVHPLGVAPADRSGALRRIAGDDRRVVLAAATEEAVRAGRSAELLAIGVFSGPCSKKRLLQAGADLVYADLADLAESAATGGKDLLEAGLLPEAAPG